MNEQNGFSESELELIEVAKKTLKILAKVIRDKDPKEVIKDKDLAEIIGDKDLTEALKDEDLAKMIEDRLTPGLPALNANEEAIVIGQLGPVIFAELLEKATSGNLDDEPN